MLPTPVAYLTYTGSDAPAVPAGKAYAYVLAGNGLFKLARNQHLEALVPLAPCRVAGLPPLEPFAHLRAGLLPSHLLPLLLDDARRVAWDAPREAMYHLVMNQGRVYVTRPVQTMSAGHVHYEGSNDPALVLDLHSHHEMKAFFSGTDNRDEQGFRFYGVMGTIFRRPTLRLRIGVYGDHWEVPATALFTDLGPFRQGGKREN